MVARGFAVLRATTIVSGLRDIHKSLSKREKDHTSAKTQRRTGTKHVLFTLQITSSNLCALALTYVQTASMAYSSSEQPCQTQSASQVWRD